MRNDYAYKLGALRALRDCGMLKEAGLFGDDDPAPDPALPVLLGSLGGAIAAPAGHRLAGFGGTMLGGGLGAVGGGLGGAGLGALLGLIAKRPELGAMIGAGLGVPAGMLGGRYIGYKKALE